MRKILVFAILSIVIYSCTDTDLDLQDNPNKIKLSPKDIESDLVLNGILLNMNSAQRSLSNSVTGVVRHRYMRGAYSDNITINSMNTAWSNTYKIGKNLNLLKDLEKGKGMAQPQVAVAQIAKAYTLLNLVDFIGTAVYDQANSREFNNPKLEAGEEIYPKIISLLDNSIKRLKSSTVIPLNDPFTVNLSTNRAKLDFWIKFANTIKIKMYLQTRLVNSSESKNKINKILNSSMYIMSELDDVNFMYSSVEDPLDARHPSFKSNYIDGGKGYISNGFMFRMLVKEDPRMKYYFYRQTDSDPGGSDLSCSQGTGSDFEFCSVGGKYWGRDHCDDAEYGRDKFKRTVYGSYPAGGSYDCDLFISAYKTSTTNLDGKGINPIMLSSYVDFMLAESSLTIGTNGNSKELLLSAVRKSFEKVGEFIPLLPAPTATQIPSPAAIDKGGVATQIYLDALTTEYEGATSVDEKLNIIVREYHTASFGNSIEAYNTYRRTGMPHDMPNPQMTPGRFPLSMFLPESEVRSNTSINQKVTSTKVFWDKNPESFLDATEVQD